VTSHEYDTNILALKNKLKKPKTVCTSLLPVPKVYRTVFVHSLLIGFQMLVSI